MPTKTKIVFIAALLLGAASGASATEFDPYLGNRHPAYTEPVAAQHTTARARRGFVQAPASLRGAHSNVIVGRQIAAPPWSAACMTDHGPSECGEPMWIYGSPSEIARYRSAF